MTLLRRLAARRGGSHGANDQGVIAIIVAICMVMLLGFATIVIDVGTLYAERRQLQNGADAAALGVAIDCAKAATCNGGGTAMGTATPLANGNALDNATTVTQVCGTGPGLAACSPAAPAGPWDCPALDTSGPTAGAKYVQVRVQTLRNGSNLMPPIFAKVLEPGYDGTTVKACARAAYGAPSTAGALAVTESICEWNLGTSNGTNFASPPPYPPNPAGSFERVIYLHTTAGLSHCPAGPSGADVPGGFGWLDDPNGTCQTTVTAGGTYGGDPGASISKACKDALSGSQQNKTVVYIPIFDAVSGTGQNSQYHLKGFAAFVVTGYHLPGLTAKSWLTGNDACKGSDKCIYGFFTQGLIPAGGTIGGPSMGANVIQLTG
jgi:Flp pilus assembly protein TadG